MSHFLDRLTYFSQPREDVCTRPRRHQRVKTAPGKTPTATAGQHDKIVRSTHGVNCTGSCSWKVYVKGGIVTWETQQTDYPRTRHDLPNHEPRGCARGASYSWYLYSANRVKYPMVRGRAAQALARCHCPRQEPGGRLGQHRRATQHLAAAGRRSAAWAASCAAPGTRSTR